MHTDSVQPCSGCQKSCLAGNELVSSVCSVWSGLTADDFTARVVVLSQRSRPMPEMWCDQRPDRGKPPGWFGPVVPPNWRRYCGLRSQMKVHDNGNYFWMYRWESSPMALNDQFLYYILLVQTEDIPSRASMLSCNHSLVPTPLGGGRPA